MLQQYMHIRDNFDLPGIVISIEEVERLKMTYMHLVIETEMLHFLRGVTIVYTCGELLLIGKKLTQFPQNIQQKILDTTENSTTSNVSNNGKQIFHKDDQSVSSKFEVDMTSLEREDPVQERLLEHVSQCTVPHNHKLWI